MQTRNLIEDSGDGNKFVSVRIGDKWLKPDLAFQRYTVGKAKPNYPVPATIGFQTTQYGTYMFDTRTRCDGMPLFRGYTWNGGDWY